MFEFRFSLAVFYHLECIRCSSNAEQATKSQRGSDKIEDWNWGAISLTRFFFVCSLFLRPASQFHTFTRTHALNVVFVWASNEKQQPISLLISGSNEIRKSANMQNDIVSIRLCSPLRIERFDEDNKIHKRMHLRNICTQHIAGEDK